MNRLKKNLAYLIGPMDEADDRGVGWREHISSFLHKLGVGVLNPCDKPTIKASETPETIAQMSEWKSQGRYDELSNMMKKIVSVDLHMVDLSNFVIMYIDKDIHMCGSYNEQTYACLEHKPVIVCCKQGKENVPNWLFGIADHGKFFGDWDEVECYLEYIAHSPRLYLDIANWRFLDYNKIFPVEDK